VTSDGLDAVNAEPRGGSFVSGRTEIEKEGANFSSEPSLGQMTVYVQPPGPERTRAMLEEIVRGPRGARLRAEVARTKREATREQVEEAFQEACLKAGTNCRGQTIGEVYNWLRKAIDSHVDDILDRVKREVLVDHSIVEAETIDSSLVPVEEVVIKSEERAEIDRLALAIVERLPERERKVAVLHSHGFARKEIASHLGLTPRVVKRSVEEVLAAGRAQLTKLVGYGCPDGHDLVTRYAFGLAVGGEARRAQLHLMSCPRCGAMYEGLDLWRERVAALLPVPPSVEAHAHIVERVVHAGSDVLSGGHTPRPERVGGLRRHAVDAAASLREQAAAASYRTVDPTPIAGFRPGAVAAAVAGCLALGGGATYCVQQGTDPFTALAGLGAQEHHVREKPKSHHKRGRAAQATAPPVAMPTVTTPTQAVQQTTTPAPTTTTTAQPPPAPEDQFEPTSAGANAQTATQTSTSKPRQPAPAPADGPSEFGGP
jgi:RNA polymerase sigma factor (sigma-70 family)